MNGRKPIVISVMPMLGGQAIICVCNAATYEEKLTAAASPERNPPPDRRGVGAHLDQPHKFRDNFVNIKGATLICKAGKRENMLNANHIDVLRNHYPFVSDR
jgi:hypothetical protein